MMLVLAIALYLVAGACCLAARADLGRPRREELNLSGWAALNAALFAVSGTWCLYQ